LSALRELIGGLPASLGIPVVVVQHRHRQSDHLLTTLLQDETSLCVCEVEDKAPMTGGNVYVAPADYHLLVENGFFSLSTDEPVRFSRPSIDVTFQSAADTYGARTVGVVLTGANADGSQGLRRIISRGAKDAVPEARVLTIAEIATAIAALPVAIGKTA